MNDQIRQVYGLFIVLFALLVGFTSYWAVLDAEGLEDNPDNRRALIEEQTIPRGLIFASDGRTRIAVNRSERRGDARIFVREYPQRGLFAHPIGYSFIQNGRRSLEQSRNGDLVGQENEFESIFAGLEGRDREGNDVVTNLDVAGTQAAVAGLAGRKGGVVAIEPQTGKVRVMVSIPEYDPNLIPTDFRALDTDPDKPTLNRTTQELLSARLDFQGRDRDRGARHRQGHARDDHRRLVAQGDQRRAAGELGRAELRADLVHRRAHELRQHRVRAGRRGGRPRARSSST